VLIYATLLLGLLVALVATARAREASEVTILRGIGAPFEMRDGQSVNQIRVKVQNRASGPRRFRIELLDAPGARLIAPENPLAVGQDEQRSTSVFVMVDPRSLPNGRRAIRFRVTDGEGFSLVVPYQLLGPQQLPVAGSGP
jgi:uncharacterized protein (DUF58 family)